MRRRVVVTGIGLVTPLGIGSEAFWEGLTLPRRVIGPITRFDASGYSTRIAAEVKDFDPNQFMDRRDARRASRFIQFAVAATTLALQDAQLEITDANRERIGVLIGSGIGGIDYMDAQVRILDRHGPERISPFLPVMMIPDMASGFVSIQFGLKGPNLCAVTACSTGADAIGLATRLIQYGDADVMLAGGSEAAIEPIGIAAFCAARAMSTRNDDPEHASRPFDAERDGFVMGEGAGVLVLEALEHAQARGARIYAEVLGYGATADAYHVTQPDPEGDGAARAMRKALQDAGLQPTDIDYINAHGTSTRYNDAKETLAIKRVFGEYAYQLPVSSTKSVTGHLLGAAGAVETAACILALQHQTIPPTINYEHPDPECDLDYVPNTPRPAKLRYVMNNSFGFGGHNSVLVLGQFSA
ncbi:MAG: beta-ketoacyl-ACP synthase II [Fimbriimonadales bacterium]|nr:beta-ketoacyl-ACP synthase II [Fimbriimonadales bacterium]MDW8052337.1 beta-ketoacyl-ACP synthase II [Armatimonadota bacterium]